MTATDRLRHEAEPVSLHSVRHSLQQTILGVQELMAAHPPSRRLEHALAMLWAVADSFEELDGAHVPH